MSLIPDRILNTFDELTVAYLKERGIDALIMDIDNTLIPYEETLPREGVKKWIDEVTAAGIKIAFVTNNHKSRLDAFNESLGFPAFHDSCKPFSRNMRKAMRAMGSTPENTANIGDQIFTDVWAGKRLKLQTLLVPPIRDKRDVITRFKRFLERSTIRKYYKRHTDEINVFAKGKENE